MNRQSTQVVTVLDKEVKSCGHHCYPSKTLTKCCSCEDTRPIPAEGGGYECYIDGIGFTTTATRDDGYCPVCNTKNYDRWMARIDANKERKRKEDVETSMIASERSLQKERDRQENCGKDDGTVRYSDGGVYVGGLKDGMPHGLGRMEYGDNEDNAIYYEGQWIDGQHQGNRKKVWCDDIWYEGEWKSGMMHGNGTHHPNDVDILSGRFEEDEFCY